MCDNAEPKEITIESLTAKLDEAQEALKVVKVTMEEAEVAKEQASNDITRLNKQKNKAQQAKNSCCSLKQNQVSLPVYTWTTQ
jgi:uncharacterized membrane protein (DUF106 family)